jgi:uncharacterized protein with GYD domain
MKQRTDPLNPRAVLGPVTDARGKASATAQITKFALAFGSLGNVRTRTSRAWTEAEWTKLIFELP